MTPQFDRFDDILGHAPSETPFVYREDAALSLHFQIGTVQSRMDPAAPDRLVLGYTRTMMGFLLFKPQPARIALIGLGGGSLVKYCHRHLPGAALSVAEISPEVIALRRQFHVPDDDARLRVLCVDGADFVRGAAEAFDVLLVDGFDLAGQPAQLCSQHFYDDCHAALADDGLLVVNLSTGDARHPAYLARIRRSFDGAVLAVAAEDSDNRIVFAGRGRALALSARGLGARLAALAPLHPIGLDRTAAALREAREAGEP
ncbi:spermidine synthase [Plasticicumulans lactativorans]|uniref:Spermidine synthase n=1 Tax=Plasticicumulans lactativorans TaxID=1133106 RepID=A0A4R2L8X4_9GAMM|nr:transferase [Plasticicumulans lactativorans]TCO81766.1 spermidine synthase [Plasticicumulans lactativorans]